MNKKIASELAIGIILFVAIIVGGIFYWQSKKVQTVVSVVNNQQPIVDNQQAQLQSATDNQLAQINNDAIATPENWKTYSNDKLGFGFSYPSNWYVIDSPKDKAIDIQNAPGVRNIGNAPKNFKHFFITYDQAQIANPIGSEPNSKTLSVNGIQIKHSKDSVGPGGSEWTINGVNYLILYSFPNPSDEEIDVMNKVVHTLMPVNASADETADWQTYTNAKLGFELKYPAGYVAKIPDANELQDAPSFFVSNPNKNELIGIMYNHVLDLNIDLEFIGAAKAKGVVKTPDEWVSLQKETGDNYTKTTLGGQVAYVRDYVDYHDTVGGRLLPKGIDSKEYIVFLSSKENAKNYDMYQFIIRKDDVGDEILSTLKFIK